MKKPLDGVILETAYSNGTNKMVYIETSEGALCKNKECENYNCWEDYEFNEAKDDGFKTYYICRECGERIYVD